MKRDIKKYQFFKKLCILPFIDTIYLFGSRARGDFRERSDIDLAIECPQATKKDWSQVMAIIENADTLLSIDCVRLDMLNNNALLEEINAHKILMFERKKNDTKKKTQS